MFTSKLNAGTEAVRFRIKTSTYVFDVAALCIGPEMYAEIETSLF
jgi:hypothetical protein